MVKVKMNNQLIKVIDRFIVISNSIVIFSIDLLLTPHVSSQPKRTSQVQSTPDVQISRFDKDATTSKAAFARSQLAKRFLSNQAQQRPVPIQSLSNTSNTQELSSHTNSDPQSATSLAATVAASVAVSVAQPFLKLQNDLEHRMNSVLDQIQQQQQRATTSGTVVPITTIQPPTNGDSSKLLHDSVDTRMKYVEKVQEQQQQVLKQLVDMVNTTKPTIKSPKHDRKSPIDNSSPPPQQYHFLDTLVGNSSPPVRQTKSHKKHSTQKKSSTSPSAQKRPSRVTGATGTRIVKIRSPVKFKEQPPNGRFNIETGSPYNCSVCDRSRSRSRSHSPTKGLSPDSSYPRPFAPVPRPASIMSDGFIPSHPSTLTSVPTTNALKETYAPFDKYLNNSMPPSPFNQNLFDLYMRTLNFTIESNRSMKPNIFSMKIISLYNDERMM